MFLNSSRLLANKTSKLLFFSRKNAPCSRGTTVTILKLFDYVPVRQATIKKSASKLINQVWPLLVSYYLTHPGIRFAFQLVHPPEGNNGKKQIDVKYNVIFAATKTIENAIRSSLGGEYLSACIWKEFPTLTEEEVLQLDGYKVEAFLLKPSSGKRTSFSTHKHIYCLARVSKD